MSAFTGNHSCSVGGSDGGLDEAAAREMLEELESTFQPSARQEEMMFSLCRQLRLDFTETTRPLTTHALYSSTLTELSKLRNAEQNKTAEKITPAQEDLLVTLGVPRGDALSKQAASTMISQKLAEREAQPATGPQLRLLEDLKYTGSTPVTKSKASKLIHNIRIAKRIKYLKEKARRKGTPPAMVEKLIALVEKYGL